MLFGIVQADDHLDPVALKALGDDPVEASEAISRLRAIGPRGIDALLEAWADLDAADDPAAIGRYHRALDAVCAQRDCHASRLYWHTDLDRALEAAKATGRPVLSLHLLGRLDESLSCANSRYFRSAVYPDAAVAALLRERFVLHWWTTRSVPRIRIDFGDGRRLERTITGNSIHYVLDADGRVIDALPGLYGPGAFARELELSLQLAGSLSRRSGWDRERTLKAWHRARIDASRAVLAADLARLGSPVKLEQLTSIRMPGQRQRVPSAYEAGRLAMSKAGGELPVVRRISPDEETALAAQEEEAWRAIGRLHSADARLDAGSIAVIQSHLEGAARARGEGIDVARTLETFERSMAEDTVRNQLQLRPRLHAWFASGEAGDVLEPLNARVYSELFLTPAEDPWMGLAPVDTYNGLENEGIWVPPAP